MHNNYFSHRERRARNTAIILGAICISILLLATSCKKEIDTNKPPKFALEQHVHIEFDATKSFVPHCGTPVDDFIVKNVYTVTEQLWYFYDLETPDGGCKLIHVAQNQLKR